VGSLKDKALETANEDAVKHTLTDSEINYLKLLNLTLQYHTMGQRIMSGFLFYVATTRLGYPEGVDLQFELDLQKDDKILTVTLMPAITVTPKE
jgi:hypothetical protein